MRSGEFETLVDWIDGRLPAQESADVAAWVSGGDERTQAIVVWLREFVAVGKELPLEEPPPIVRQRLRAHFSQWRDSQAALHHEIARFDAAMLFDSRSRAALSGTRGAVTDDVVHLAYTTEVADLVLDVQRLTDHRVRIDGQMLLVETGGGPVFEATVSGPGFEIRTVDGDFLGRFQLDAVPETVHLLQVTNGEITVTARLDLRAARP